MVETKRYAFDGETEPGTVELDEEIFAADVNSDLMYRAVRTQLLRRRRGTSSTKTRSEVRGGGRKPWRQKGTGRARAGSIRSPLWNGGGVVFGPQPKEYTVSLPKKMRQGALRSALSDRAQREEVVVVDAVAFDAPRTKDAIRLLKSLGVEGSALVVVGREESRMPVHKSFSNLSQVKCLAVDGLNVYDVLRHDAIVFSEAALEALRKRL